MKTSLYTYYDRIAMQCEGIFHARNNPDAMRHFVRRFEKRDDAEEFNLLYLGTFDHDDGVAEMLDVPETIPVKMPEKKIEKQNKEGHGNNGNI